MRSLNPREKRTVRLSAIGIAIYLAAFGGWQAWRFGEGKRAEYQKLSRQARELRDEIQLYRDKAELTGKLMEEFRLDPARLSRTTAVADASAAIQKAAKTGGIAIGAVRETPVRGSKRELASLQIEGSGPVPAVMGFFQRLQTVGYPVVVESVQLATEANRPGQIKVSLTLLILDFDQWKKEGGASA